MQDDMIYTNKFVGAHEQGELKNFSDLQNQYIIITGTLPFHESIYRSGTLDLVCILNLNSYIFLQYDCAKWT